MAEQKEMMQKNLREKSGRWEDTFDSGRETRSQINIDLGSASPITVLRWLNKRPIQLVETLAYAWARQGQQFGDLPMRFFTNPQDAIEV